MSADTHDDLANDGNRGDVASRRYQRIIAICAVAALAWGMTARIIGPSDTFHQTQPKTVSYTSDIIAHGRWVLPIERGTMPATKPPLYNWIAVPFVKVFGFASDLGHKFPSLLAVVGCFALLVGVGRRISGPGQVLGWMTAMFFVANYAIFKLGYLARPDMILTFWLLLSWAAATMLLAERSLGPATRRAVRLAFWISVGLAGLTKGPVLIVPILYMVIAARAIRGSWRAAAIFQAWWGIPFSLCFVGVWVTAAWFVDPEHVRQVLWHDEIWGRLTGTGPEGNQQGLWGWARTFWHMPAYLLTRLLPWSIPAVLCVVTLLRRGADGGARRVSAVSPTVSPWLIGAMWWIAVELVIFTVSTGKRADYIAGAFGPASLLAAWWLLSMAGRSWRDRPWLLPAVAGATMIVLTVFNERDAIGPVPGFGDEINAFARQALQRMEAEPLPVAYWNAGGSHLQAYLGHSQVSGGGLMRTQVDGLPPGGACWVVAGRAVSNPIGLDELLGRIRPGLRIEAVVRTDVLPRTALYLWPGEVTLFRVERPAAGGGL